ncbi:MAG: hypothetical protein KatS3mg068_0410 [Candidatus Sericytochromatia bacterium]|nr:MAG: hypothetical protein KatS3mg068_0410 [Candidatus Sericytochromatia bacterium]
MEKSKNIEHLTRIERLGELLVRLNALKLSQLTELIEEQKKNPGVKLGELIVSKGLMSRDEIVKYLEMQVKEGKVIDDTLKEIEQLEENEKWNRLVQHERLGEILLRKKVLKLSQLSEAMEEHSKNKSKPLGQLLLEKGIINEKDLQEALEFQEKQNETLKETVEEIKSV